MASQSQSLDDSANPHDFYAAAAAAEREICEMAAEFFLSLQDLLHETWNSSYDALRNIRLLIGSVSKYLFSHRKIDLSVRRIREGNELKAALAEIYRFWMEKGPVKCTSEQMLSFFRKSVVYPLLTKGILSEETFQEWVQDYRAYVNSVIITSDERKDVPDAIESSSSDEAPVVGAAAAAKQEEEARETGLDALFERTSEIDANRISQHISKFENGRLFTVKSPGEIGAQLIRLYVYDVKDITKRDKRVWWKYAKLRAQFLSSHARTDRKRQLLRRLLDEAADDLGKVTGVTSEVRNLPLDGGAVS